MYPGCLSLSSDDLLVAMWLSKARVGPTDVKNN